MHIRVSKMPSGKYGVQLAVSYRNGTKVGKRIVRHIGTAAPGKELEKMRRKAAVELERLRNAEQGNIFPDTVLADMAVKARQLHQLKTKGLNKKAKQGESQRIVLGIHEVFGELYSRARFDQVLPKRYTRAGRLLRDAVLMRLAEPGRSKLAHARLMEDRMGKQVSVDLFYRMMDALDDDRIAKLQELVARQSASLLDDKIGVLFADATTLYFEATQPDGLRRRGYSKDGKPHRLQVVLAVVMAADGLPLGYRLYPGNTADIATLLPALADIRTSWQPKQPLVVVADAGMDSKRNREGLLAAGCEYILAARLRQLPAAAHEQAIDLNRYSPPDARGVRRLDLQVQERRLVMVYNPKHAARTKHGREDQLRSAEQSIRSGNVLRSRYVSVANKRAELNRERIAADEKLDGLHGVWTSLRDVDAAQVRSRYAELHTIENGFRVLKHDLGTRPVFHWTERRVRAHVAICFAAFALLRTLIWHMRAYRQKGEPVSEAGLLEALRNVQGSVNMNPDTGKLEVSPSNPTSFQKAIYRSIKLDLTHDTVTLP